jgi:hypothetical protein
MSSDVVVAALRGKRADLANRRAALVAELTGVEHDLEHLDRTIQLFTSEPGSTKTMARPVLLPGVRPGQTARLALDVLRTAPGPMTAQEIAHRLCEQRGVRPEAGVIARVSNALVMALRQYERRGVVVEVGRTAVRAVLWQRPEDQFTVA